MHIARCAVEFPPDEGETADHRVRCWRWRELAETPLDIRGPLREITEAKNTLQQPSVVSVRDVSAFYQHKEVLHGVSAELREHRCLALVGESGSGKTTLARCIAGLHPFRIDGDIELRARRWRATRAAARAPSGRPSSTSSRARTAR